jgi:PhnB protein
MQLTPTIYFPGICDDAIAFYGKALGAELLFLKKVATDIPPAQQKPGTEHKVLRAALRIGESVVYLSDGHRDTPAFAGFSLTLTLPDRAAAQRMLDALADGGDVRVPLRETSWTGAFGAVCDRFGMHWLVQVTD